MGNSHFEMEEQLNDLGIFALRELARRTGVNSPTSKKKDELIKEIIDINNGIKRPNVSSKLGRPPKSSGYDMSNIFSYNLPTQTKSDNVLVLNQDVDVVEDDSVRYRGVIELLSDSVAFLWVFNKDKYYNFYIPASLVKKYNLKSGDICFALVSNNDGQTVVKELLTVNSIPIAKYSGKRQDYSKITHLHDKEKIDFKSEKFSALNMNKGDNLYVYGNNYNESTEFVINLLNDAKIQNKIYLNVSIVEKSKHILKSINCADLYVSNLTDELETSRRVINLATERAMRAIEDGEDAIVVIDDALSVVGVDMQDMSLLRKLMSITKKADKGSISIVAVMDKNKTINQIEKLADSKFYI